MYVRLIKTVVSLQTAYKPQMLENLNSSFVCREAMKTYGQNELVQQHPCRRCTHHTTDSCTVNTQHAHNYRRFPAQTQQ